MSPFLESRFYRPARPHRKRRLAKKFRRKYGMVLDRIEDKGPLQMGNKVLVSPTMMGYLRTATSPAVGAVGHGEEREAWLT